MPVAAGTRLGPYEILALIGKGGMGEVYRARDLTLKRDVALKLLPPAFAQNADRMARFQREAEVLASLNHPNIAHIFGIAESDEDRALAMELAEGESPKGPMPFDDAWKIATQIAAALGYAHEHGVIHRDLKPANVKVTPDGVVKLLDFGLAKAYTAEREAPKEASPEISPTLTIGATQAGVILGTAAYMSPEQARGKNVDKRADIWAFGVLLYELLIGDRPFQGEDIGETLASVIKHEPDLSCVPPPARELIRSCLEKDPKRRLRDIGDAARLISGPGEIPVQQDRSKLPWIAAAVALGVGATGGWLFHKPPASESEVMRFEIEPPEGGKFASDAMAMGMALSSDGAKLRSATDGEFRRAMWHFDFLERLDGVESFRADHGIAFKGGIETQAKGLRVVGKLGFSGHPMLEHFRFLRDHTRAVPKMTIPSPSVLHLRGGRRAVDARVYPEMDEFYSDLGSTYRGAVQAFAELGCRYLQLDEVDLAYLCDPEQRQMLRDRGDNPDILPQVYARMINTAISGRPADMVITMHLCRGNFRSSWIAQGGYEPVAELLFNEIGVDGYFMEFDTERAGGFEPLRFVPKGKTVVLGIVTSKVGTLENVDHLQRRIEEAARFVDLEQLCLSPQCGFASTEEGNAVTEDEQWAKLARIVEVASKVWDA